jgi:hypothetical protein
VIFGRQQKLLTPVVLGAGVIALNAADNDEKLEISKIIPSPTGDSDTKITSPLELPEVLKRLANLGAGYPEIVSLLETAQRQKNLAGELVVDAVPTTTASYLEAVLGKDTTGKKDDAVKRTSGSSSRWRFFGLFGGDSPAPAKSRSAGSSSPSGSSSDSLSAPPLEMPPLPDSPDAAAPPASKSASGKNDAPGAANPAGKKDDAVERTSASDDDDAPPPRRRLSDLFRKNDDS